MEQGTAEYVIGLKDEDGGSMIAGKIFWSTLLIRNTCSVCQKRRAVSHDLCWHCQERVTLFVVSRRVKRNWQVPTQPSRGDKADQVESRRRREA